MPITTVSSKGQLVIPKEIRNALGIKPKQKMNLKIVEDHVEMEPLPENPVEYFCGIFKEGSSLTEALLREREEDKKREEKRDTRFLRSSGLSKTRKRS
jgi:AbrB family looped-hinge helix DNA binding protein